MTDGQESLHALLQRAAAAQDPDERHTIVAEVHGRTDQAAFEAASDLARSSDPDQAELGLDILGQLGYPAGRPFLEDSLPLVIARSGDDRQEIVSSAIVALGHLADPRGLPATLAQVAHPCEQVRLAVAFALPSVAGHPPDNEAVDALVRLTSDPDPEVRDWATMGLSDPFDADSEEIRDALAARLTDGEGDIAGRGPARAGPAQGPQGPRPAAGLAGARAREPYRGGRGRAGRARGTPRAAAAQGHGLARLWQDVHPRPGHRGLRPRERSDLSHARRRDVTEKSSAGQR